MKIDLRWKTKVLVKGYNFHFHSMVIWLYCSRSVVAYYIETETSIEESRDAFVLLYRERKMDSQKGEERRETLGSYILFNNKSFWRKKKTDTPYIALLSRLIVWRSWNVAGLEPNCNLFRHFFQHLCETGWENLLECVNLNKTIVFTNWKRTQSDKI